ncbi:hypothetical protein PR001_g19418 [Phytophthora rubi]|uniref:Retroviral polymerase SH3-like domain-containing protein n=1 Tax=Phytophthora rubi TaxID=129364 RepID=A0A6A3JXV3_9STRA|nr:hypothetical protein PR001_g19418 [Phytophthora rubi]
MSATKALNGITPHEKLFGKKPVVRNLHVCGSVVFHFIPKKKRKTKLDMRFDPGIFLGCAKRSLGYRILDLCTGNLVERRDVVFHEDMAADPKYLLRKKNSESARLSGVTESHTEKDFLLDELLSKLEDSNIEKPNKNKVKAEKAAAQESAGEAIRRLAVERLKRKREGERDEVSDSPSKGKKLAKLVDLLREQKKQEMAARQKQWVQERLDRQATETRFMQLLEMLAKRS